VGPFKKSGIHGASSTKSLSVMMALIFPRRVFGGPRFLRAAFFAWSVALQKILTMDNFRKWHGTSLWSIGVICTRGIGSL
jgi:hypothetical protein